MSRFEAGLDGVAFTSEGCRLLGGFYRAEGEGPRPTAVLHMVRRASKSTWTSPMPCAISVGIASTFIFAAVGDRRDRSRSRVWPRIREPQWIGPESTVRRRRSHRPDRREHGIISRVDLGAADLRIRAIVGISPLIEPRAFEFPKDDGGRIRGHVEWSYRSGLVQQWEHVQPLSDVCVPSPRDRFCWSRGTETISFRLPTTPISSPGSPTFNG